MKYIYLSIFLIGLYLNSAYSHINNISKCPISSKYANCLECKDSLCLKCNKGYFLHESECLNKCPVNMYANNFTKVCTLKPVEASYLKVFTVSRCVNKCGVEFSDCSCSLSCTRKGDCCSDFKVCEIIQQNYNDQDQDMKNRIQNCKFDSNEHKICLQCKDGFFLYHGKCFTNCPDGTTSNSINNICLSSENQTQKCINGTFNHQGNCVEICPINFYANRINNTCVKSDVYSFHWVFPSKSTCEKECGKIANPIKFPDKDCSCDDLCARRGDCCDDFDHFCENSNQIKIDKINLKNKKPALRKIRQDNQDDKGDLQNINKIISKIPLVNKIIDTPTIYKKIDTPTINKKIETPTINKKIDTPTTRKNSNEFDFNKMQEYLFSLIPKMSSRNDQHSLNSGSYITIDGNSTINVYKGNKNLKIVNSHTKNIHSHNKRKIIRENTGSNNIIRGRQEEFKGFDLNDYLKMKKEHEENIQTVKKFINVATDILSNSLPENIVPYNSTNSTSFKNDYNESLQINKNNFELNLNPNTTFPTNQSDNQNKTQIIHYKTYYVHNNIYVDDKSLSMMNPNNPNLFNITKNNYFNSEVENPKNVSSTNIQNSDNLLQQLENSEERKKISLNLVENNEYPNNQHNIDTMIIIKNREEDQQENNNTNLKINQQSNSKRKNLNKPKFTSRDIINEFRDFNELNKQNNLDYENS